MYDECIRRYLIQFYFLVLMEWLESLAVHGIAMLKNSPLDIGVVKSLANRIGFIRKTTYG